MNDFHNRGIECPECGDTRTATRAAGLDQEGHRIRERGCVNCGHRFSTVEIVFPFSFPVVDVTKRVRREERGETKHPPRRSPDYIEVKRGSFAIRKAKAKRRDGHVTVFEESADGEIFAVRLVRGRRSNMCRRGLHRLVGENVYVNKKTGQRVCNPCRRENTRKRYYYNMEHPAFRKIRQEIDARYRQRKKLRKIA